MIPKGVKVRRILELWSLGLTPLIMAIVAVIFFTHSLRWADFFLGILVMFGLYNLVSIP